MGLKHYTDFLERMPREEAAEIEQTVSSSAPGLRVEYLLGPDRRVHAVEMSLAVIAELFSLSSEQGHCLGDPFWARARKAPTLPRRKVQFECLARRRILHKCQFYALL